MADSNICYFYCTLDHSKTKKKFKIFWMHFGEKKAIFTLAMPKTKKSKKI
jgi:hypothetical protein